MNSLLDKPSLKPLVFAKGKIDPHPIIRPPIRNNHDLSTGTLRISETKQYDFTSNDLVDRGVIGEGNFGIVCNMLHEKSNTPMAVKRIRSTVDEQCQKQMLLELDIVMKENSCPYIVQFYGALFKETLQALHYIKERWQIIHRDVKPSNILVSRTSIKLCDFGISGQLIDSIAKTRDAGCKPYLPPERIDPKRSTRGYDVRSDVWSLGISIYELATGYFPFREWTSPFDQLQQVVEGPPLKLTSERLSKECCDFVTTCLNKDETQRPKYKQLLESKFIQHQKELNYDPAPYLSKIIDGLITNNDSFELYYYMPHR
ncbi:unnamed protein product [Didymodactylos carnosus]|uniref:mitogen-activated protein kinase kinase n=1 Tax=Didymodactylos carnosus TaxID=1234261 RepID=A0A813UB73_9BILA|nr:unnamed protein product [Didymodactylos carnosus]CAF0942350.1 unnamed protein product [Didymodactylos carnosus]CAF3610394.1 unnamed protein product [Didymodactylos carnosus]CAF3717315.1 unnamed protein product [Didymodactylos carnosus]